MKNRITNHPVLGEIDTSKTVTFTYDGVTYEGIEGDTIASALLANGMRTLRVHEESAKPRGIYCNIGHCFECRVTVDSQEGIRACLTPIKANMKINSGKQQPLPFENQEPRTYTEYESMKKAGDLDV